MISAKLKDDPRDIEVQRIKNGLQRNSYPKAQMFFLVALTGVTGFLSSFCLLRVGVEQMWLRYGLSMCAAYMGFLFFLWLWLNTKGNDYDEAVEVADSALDIGSSFAGGSDVVSAASSGVDSGGGVLGEALSAAASAEVLAIPLIIMVLIGAMALSSVFIVYTAPELFAELLVDGALSAQFYKSLRKLEKRHWLSSALRRTVAPFILTTALVVGTGWGMGHYMPGAKTMGEAVSMWKVDSHAQPKTK